MKITAAALCLVSTLALGGSASAAERGLPPIIAPTCAPLEKFKANFAPKTKFSMATIGEFHVLKGVYLANPKTPEGNPPGDGALIVTPPVPHGQMAVDFITWTRNGGKDVCAAPNQVLAIPASVMVFIAQTETGKDETADPDDSKDELKL
jgi:hypothetical protein